MINRDHGVIDRRFITDTYPLDERFNAESEASFPRATYGRFTVAPNVLHSTNRWNPHGFVKDIGQVMVGESTQIWYYGSSNTVERRFNVRGVVYGEAPTLPVPTANDSYNRALAKVYERIRSGTDLSVSVAEAGQTFKMLKSAVTLGHLIGSVNPSNWSKRIVEFQLGWRPLVADLYGATEEVLKRVPQMLALTERASAKDDRVVITKLPMEDQNRSEKSYHRTQIQMVYTPSTSYVDNFARFTSLNPVSVAWELVPFSFLLDYVFNIGSFLRMAESSIVLSGFSQGTITRTSLLEVAEDRIGNGVRQSSNNSALIGSWKGYRSNRTKDRTVFDALPVPRAPVFRVRMGASRIITVAALLDVFMRSPSPKGVQKRRKALTVKLDSQLKDFALSRKRGVRRPEDFSRF